MAEVKEHPPAQTSLYERDFALWAEEQARLLKSGRLHELDIPNLIDEVLDLGGSQRRAIENNLIVVLSHLLKWRFQPRRRSRSWHGSIVEHRQRIELEIEASPSLRVHPSKALPRCYARARRRAAAETGLSLRTFPETPPFTVEQALDPDFLPE